jgi:metal-dependent amidase/aminoacylase/carboxypeptidase family protein
MQAAAGKIEADIRFRTWALSTINDTHPTETLEQSLGAYFKDEFFVPGFDSAVEDFSRLGPSVPFVYWKLGSTPPSE